MYQERLFILLNAPGSCFPGGKPNTKRMIFLITLKIDKSIYIEYFKKTWYVIGITSTSSIADVPIYNVDKCNNKNNKHP